MLRRVMMALGVVLLAACVQTQALNARPPETAVSVSEPGSARAQELLSKLVGRWVLTGEIAGQSTVHDVEAAWAVQGNYVRISEISRERADNGQPAYEATIYIGWAKDHYACFWLDNTEVASGDVACKAAEAPDAIPLEFRDAQGALSFTNTFAYNRAADTWEWRMANVRGAEVAPFGRVTLRRR